MKNILHPKQDLESSSDRDYNERAKGMDTREDSVEGEEEIREGESLETKKGKKTITIKILKSKEDSTNISRGQKKKTF